MSSLVERLRVRSEKRPRYILDESDDDLPPHGGNGKGRDRQDDAPAKQIEREDVKEDACQKCGLNDNLISCSTCTYAFHRKCLIPCLNITSDKWSCPECVSPLTEMEKILDCETPKVASEETSSPESRLKKKPVKRYLIKWKGLSHIHCTWVPEDEYLEAAKIHPRLKTRLNNFNRHFESIDRSDDDYVPIRPEWTTVDRVLASRNMSGFTLVLVLHFSIFGGEVKVKKHGGVCCRNGAVAIEMAMGETVEKSEARIIAQSLWKTTIKERRWQEEHGWEERR